MADETGTLTEFGGNVGATTVRTDFPNRTFIESQGGDRESFIDEDGEIAWRNIAGKPVDGFPSQWHRDSYVHNLYRELAGIDHRIANHEDDPLYPLHTAKARADLNAYRAGVVAELERMGEDTSPHVEKPAKKR
jgi:hypothetical protein